MSSSRRRRLALVSIALVVAACGAAPGPSGGTSASDAPGTSDATGGSVSFMVFGDPAERDAYRALVDAFHASPAARGTRVELIHIPDQADYRTRVAADFAAGTPANVLLLNYRRYAAYAEQGLEPIGPYLERSDVISTDDFYPAALAPFRRRGTLVCLPQNLSSLVVYYNKDRFDAAGVPYPKPGWTWEAFLETARGLTDRVGPGEFPERYGLGVEPVSLIRVAPFIWQNGGRIVDDETRPTRLTLDEPAAREAIQWFVDLQVRHRVVPSGLLERAEGSQDRWLRGTIAMFLDSRRGVPTYRRIRGFDWEVAPLPRGKEEAGILHADGYCMARATQRKDAAWRFIEYANSAEGQTIVARSGRTVPSLRSVAESEAFLDLAQKPANGRAFLDGIDRVRAVPVMERWVDIEDTVSKELELAYYGDVTVDRFIQQADRLTEGMFPDR